MTIDIAEANFIDSKCPYCGELNSFPLDASGRLRECLNCMEGFIVPESGVEVGRRIPLPIMTSRQILRRFDMPDWKDLLEFRFDSDEEAMQWLERDRTLKLTATDDIFSLCVATRDGGKVIGCLGLKFVDREFLQAEIFVSGNPDPKYGGFASEAVDGLLGFCFAELKLHRVTACCESTDALRCGLFEAVGMRREGEFLKSYCVNGEWLNSVWFAILEEEYGEKSVSSPGENSH